MRKRKHGNHPAIRDYGCDPFVFNIEHATGMNENFRTTLWTGKHLQLTLMSIPVCGNIGVEMHEDVDQFIRVESGRGKVYFGTCRDNLQERACVDGSDAILIPAGTWHNIVNIGSRPLKLYSLYAPPQHPFGTVHRTKEDAEHEEH
ncbi:MAG: cupin domain-containing protein [Clostridia bacterium]|nr:cupin domain-containing protein [Clostridia bacterium]